MDLDVYRRRQISQVKSATGGDWKTATDLYKSGVRAEQINLEGGQRMYAVPSMGYYGQPYTPQSMGDKFKSLVLPMLSGLAVAGISSKIQAGGLQATPMQQYGMQAIQTLGSAYQGQGGGYGYPQQQYYQPQYGYQQPYFPQYAYQQQYYQPQPQYGGYGGYAPQQQYYGQNYYQPRAVYSPRQQYGYYGY